MCCSTAVLFLFASFAFFLLALPSKVNRPESKQSSTYSILFKVNEYVLLDLVSCVFQLYCRGRLPQEKCLYLSIVWKRKV
jgi:hypothetical protein